MSETFIESGKAAGFCQLRGIPVLVLAVGVLLARPAAADLNSEISELYGFPATAIVTMAEVTEYLYGKEIGGSVLIDDERKAAMVSNLLVVLCGNHDAQPVVNSGSLY